jgi:Uma2 family endonuclease
MTIEQYLRTKFEPDAHFLDGRIEERIAGYYPHSRMLGLVATALDWASEEHFSCLLLRLQVSPTRIRVCDVVLLRVDSPAEQIPTIPPNVCVEILDPSENLAAALLVLTDYESMGVENIWLIDIANEFAYTYKNNALVRAADNILRSTDEMIALDINPLFQSLGHKEK